jgi:hypothetical protein
MIAAAPDRRELRLVTGRATWALAGREMRRVLGLWTQTVLPPVVTGSSSWRSSAARWAAACRACLA